MPGLTITKCVRTSKQLHVAQKGLASRVSEIYMLTTSGFADDAYLDALDEATFSPINPGEDVKPIIRTRYINDSRFICTAITYKQITVNTFQMDVEYTGYMYDGLKLDESPPVSWCRLSRRCTFRNVQLWTYPSALPANYNAQWPPTAVIAGTAVDMMGTPENYRVWHHTLDIELHIDRSYEKAMASNADSYPIYWNQYLFKRNSISFLNYPAGTVVFTGFQQAMTEDPWDTYTLSFLADQFGHLEQRVIPNVTGGVLMTNVSTWAGKPIKQADASYWYQPWNRTIANSLYNLNLLGPGGSFDEILTPTPAWIGYP